MKSNHTFAICAYKESPYIQACIDSLKQQHQSSEIIICTSTPNKYVKNVAQKNGLELKINSKKEGIAGDWNFALKQAKTKYVTLAHQDDLYFPDFTKDTLSALVNHHDSLIAFTNYHEIVHKNGSSFVRKHSLNFFVKYILNLTQFREKDFIDNNKTSLLKFGSPIGCPSVTYNLSNIHDFSFSTDFSINMDWYAWYELSRKPGSFVWVNKPLMAHRIHAESETSRGLSQNRRQMEDKIMFARLWSQPMANIISFIYSLSYQGNQ